MSNRVQESSDLNERLLFAPREPLPDSLTRLLDPDDQPPQEVARRHSVPLHPKPRRMAARLVERSRRVPAGLVAALDREIEAGTGFLLVPVFLAVGILAYVGLPSEPATHNIPAGVIFLAALRLALRRSHRFARALLTAGLLVVCGMLLAMAHTHLRPVTMTGSAVSTIVTGEILLAEPRPDGSIRYTIGLISTEKPRLRFAPERFRATVRKVTRDARPGDILKGPVRLLPPSGPARPGGYDFARHAYFDRIGANGFFLGEPEVIEGASRDQYNRLGLRLERVRLWLYQRIVASTGGASGIVAAALVTGHKSAISEADNEALRQSGLAHILSISGLHMALVAGTVMAFIRAVLALSPDRASRQPVKKQAAVIGFAAIAIYLFLAGASVATQRSFIMLAVMLGALMIDRAAITMRNLAMAAIVVLAIAPLEVTGPGFQMSFAATAALVAFYRWWALRGSDRHMVPAMSRTGKLRQAGIRFIGGLLMTSLIAGIASGLFAAYHFHRIAPFGLAGNLLAMPIVGLITMPTAIGGVLLIPFGLDGYAFRLMALSVDWVLAAAHFVADNSPPGVIGAPPLAAALLVASGLCAATMLKSRLRLAGLVAIGLGMLSMRPAEPPLFIVSEDGRQVAHVTGDGRLAVNRTRPNGFIAEQWHAAYRAPEIIKPVSGESDTAGGQFACRERDRCEIEIEVPPGQGETLKLVWLAARDPAFDPALCPKDGILVEAVTPSRAKCPETTLVITAQQLARLGAVEIRASGMIGSGQTGPPVELVHALRSIERPWHAHRQFSRAARNLEERQQRGQRETSDQ